MNSVTAVLLIAEKSFWLLLILITVRKSSSDWKNA